MSSTINCQLSTRYPTVSCSLLRSPFISNESSLPTLPHAAAKNERNRQCADHHKAKVSSREPTHEKSESWLLRSTSDSLVFAYTVPVTALLPPIQWHQLLIRFYSLNQLCMQKINYLYQVLFLSVTIIISSAYLTRDWKYTLGWCIDGWLRQKKTKFNLIWSNWKWGNVIN